MMTSSKKQYPSDLSRDELFLARMQAQCEAIEAYRLDIMRCEHRTLSLDQAAREWIERFAEDFTSRWSDRQH